MRNGILRPGTAVALLLACAAGLSPGRSEAAGEIYWFSLLTEDAAAASAFYSGLFGWDIQPSPTGALMALRDGVPFAGISQIEDRIPNASEALWLAAITVADLDKAVATAKELGATIHEDITRLPGWGSFALIQDPQGAPVSLAVPERVLGGKQGYSGWRWAELWTHDTDAAADFYSAVVGYELQTLQFGEQTYTAFSSAGKRDAGLVELEQAEIAPRWAPYVGVSDLRGILVRVWQLGGKVLREPAEINFEAAGKDRVALIADPTGGVMFLYQLDERATADPAVAARANRNQTRPNGGNSNRGGGSNINVTVHYSYGFGTGWANAYPTYPYRPFGPVPY
jgi:uncharacterized protein